MMPDRPPESYFVCTLGQAASSAKFFGHETITDFIDYQAQVVPDHAAVGFARACGSTSQEWTHTLLNFRSVSEVSKTFADSLSGRVYTREAARQTIALLCPSTLDCLFNWLGLVRLGHAVLLLAPQCPPGDVAHLCRECGVVLLLYDDVYEELAREALACLVEAGSADFYIQPIVGYDQVVPKMTVSNGGAGRTQPREIEETATGANEVAYFHHTSGTSSGIPKPIPQPHRAAVGVLPHLDGTREASFTTTPLYHGGIADLFRAWTSDALIWLFHGKGSPITAQNIFRSLDIAQGLADTGKAPAVKYFSSVPYVLQMMAAENRGLMHLQSMDIVGVGGAALSSETGDSLVALGVPLVSRFGSAECGFLLSSHRNYAKDKEWQYLRSGQDATDLRFEPREEGLSELIVCRGWPHMAKTNRDDGSYATADLFEPHASIPNAWKYHSRADAQLTLINGKKFDPAPAEAAITRSELVQDALVFGNGKPYPGALLFRAESAQDYSDSAVIRSLASFLEKLNAVTHNHARIATEMLVPISYSSKPLEKSSKGTVIRGRAEKRYATEIEKAYKRTMTSHSSETPDCELLNVVTEMVNAVMAWRPGLTKDTDLFSFGVDSIASIRIRTAVLFLLPENSRDVPLTIVEDCGTVDRLVHFLVGKRNGAGNFVNDGSTSDRQLMLDLVEEYTNFKVTAEDHFNPQEAFHGCITKFQTGHVVVLTGATGALGSHILNLYRQDPGVKKIYCLLRGQTEQIARERLNKALKQKGFASLLENDGKVTIVRAKLRDWKLGLDDGMYQEIANSATTIMHLAWAVNFRLSLRSFVHEHIAGLRNLINLSLSGITIPNFIFCSSVASVANTSAASSIKEDIETNPDAASALGYSRSKWVAEQICLQAHLNTRLRSRISIVRVGQLSGDSETGAWNITEAWPLLLGSVKATEALPALQNEILDWLPIDAAAKAFTEIAEAMAMRQDSRIKETPSVYHVINNYGTTRWTDALEWLKATVKFEIVSPQEWIEKLETMQRDGGQHPALKLLGLWKNAYGKESPQGLVDEGSESKKVPRYHLERTILVAPVIRTVKAVDRAYFEKLWRWIEKNV